MAIVNKSEKGALIKDLMAVIHDAEEILNATSGQTGDKIGATRARAEEILRHMRHRMGEIKGNVFVRAKAAAKATDQIVHESPWRSIVIASGISVLLGILAVRR